jgi:two-component system, cell cycle sensor histidine kinase and response regulator CckA
VSHARTSLGRAAELARPWLAGLALLAALASGAAAVVPGEGVSIALVAAAGALAALALAAAVSAVVRARDRSVRLAVLAEFTEGDAGACFVTDAAGHVIGQNAAARDRFGARPGAALSAVLRDAAPQADAAMERLRLREGTPAREALLVRDAPARLSLLRTGSGDHVWRLEDLPEQGPDRGFDASPLPMLTVSRAGTVVWMNLALKRLVGGRETAIERIVSDLPLRPGELHEIAGRTDRCGRGCSNSARTGPRRELCLLPPAYPEAAPDGNFFDALPVALLRIAESGEILMSNRLARNLLEIEKGSSPNLAELITGLGRPVADWLADAAARTGHGAGRGRARRAAGDGGASPDRARPGRGRARHLARGGAARRDRAQDARGAVRAEPEDAGDRPARRRRRA